MGLCMVQASGWRGARSDGRTGKPRRSEWEGIQPSALRLLLECIELRQGIAQGVVQEVTHRPRCCVPTVFEKKVAEGAWQFRKDCAKRAREGRTTRHGETPPGLPLLPFSQKDDVRMLRSTVRHLENSVYFCILSFCHPLFK